MMAASLEVGAVNYDSSFALFPVIVESQFYGCFFPMEDFKKKASEEENK